MKIRKGFVSNSSTCSFTLYRTDGGEKKEVYSGNVDMNSVDPENGDTIEDIVMGVIEALGVKGDFEIEWGD